MLRYQLKGLSKYNEIDIRCVNSITYYKRMFKIFDKEYDYILKINYRENKMNYYTIYPFCIINNYQNINILIKYKTFDEVLWEHADLNYYCKYVLPLVDKEIRLRKKSNMSCDNLATITTHKKFIMK